MAIFEHECIAIEVEKGTLGGPTYYVKHKKWQGERAICFRPVKNIPGYEHRHGAKCEREAGWNTDHAGSGACATHGGNSGKAPRVTTGTRAVQTDKGLRKKVDEYLETNKDKLLDLSFELATTRQLFENLVDEFPSPESDEFPIWQARAISMVQAIGSLVDKISKVEQRNTISANEVVYLRIIIADMFMKWIEDPRKRELALQELVSRLPGENTGVLIEANNG